MEKQRSKRKADGWTLQARAEIDPPQFLKRTPAAKEGLSP